MNPSDLPALPEEREAALLARIAELERERDEALATVKALSLENSDMKDTLDVLGSAYGSEIERADRAELERNEALAQIERIRREEADALGCAIAEVFRQFHGWRDWQELPDFPCDAVSPTSCDWAADKLEDLIAGVLQARAALRAGGEANTRGDLHHDA